MDPTLESPQARPRPGRPLRALFLQLTLPSLICLACGEPEGVECANEESRNGYLLVGATLISPEREHPLTDAWVSIEDGRIAALGQGLPPEELAGRERLDLSGKFLTPGLFDAHVHLGSVPGMTWQQTQENPKLARAYYRQLPRSYLYHGITTVLDLSPLDLELLQRLREQTPGPDILQCGPPIPLADGYPMLFAPKPARYRVLRNFLVDPTQREGLPEDLQLEEHTPAAVMQRVEVAAGLCAKTFVEDGFGPRKNWPVPSLTVLSELVQEAQQREIPLAVHANSLDTYELAVEAGAGLLVHGMWTWDAAQPEDDGVSLPPRVASVLDRVLLQQVAVMPTLRVLLGDAALFDPEFLQNPALRKVLPQEMLDWYASEDGSQFARSLLAQLPPALQTAEAARQELESVADRGRRASAYLAKHGGRILFGSDTPSGPSYGNPPGYNSYLELEAMSELGLPLKRLLAVATLDNARAFGVEDRYGSIEAGKIAHLLVLRSNPLESVRAYNNIESVVLHGQAIDRDSLRADRHADAPSP